MATGAKRLPLIPARRWLAGYRREWLAGDMAAGLAAGAVVIPKAMAYAAIAGLPLQVGLYTACLPLVVYALLGTSALLSVTSTSTIAILGAAALGPHAGADCAGLGVATATLAVLVGAILLVAPLLRLGFLANFISDPVLIGFKVGIGLVIVVDQLPKLLGLHIEKAGFLRDLASVAGQLPVISLPTLGVALGTFALLGACERWLPRAPAPLLAVGGGIAATLLLGLQARGVSVVGEIPGGLPGLALPDLSLAAQLWPAAAGIALMSFTESIAAGRAFARPEDPRLDSDRELFATGAANVVGGLFGAMPAGGGTSQTAVNRNAGARTQVAGLVTAGLSLATMLFLAPVMGHMPDATLAAVVVTYSVGLLDTREARGIRGIRWMEFSWALAAGAGVVLLGTLKGILLAVLLSMAGLLHLTNRAPAHLLGRKPGTNVFRPLSPEHPEDETFPGLLIVRPTGRLYFGNVEAMGDRLRAYVEQHHPRVLLLDLGAVPDLEYTALRALVQADGRLRDQGVDLWLADLNPEALEMLRRTPLAERLGRARMHFTVERAVAAFLAQPTG